VFQRNTLWVEKSQNDLPRSAGMLCAHPENSINAQNVPHACAEACASAKTLKNKLLLNNFSPAFNYELYNQLTYQLPGACIPFFQRTGNTGR